MKFLRKLILDAQNAILTTMLKTFYHKNIFGRSWNKITKNFLRIFFPKQFFWTGSLRFRFCRFCFKIWPTSEKLAESFEILIFFVFVFFSKFHTCLDIPSSFLTLNPEKVRQGAGKSCLKQNKKFFSF